MAALSNFILAVAEHCVMRVFAARPAGAAAEERAATAGRVERGAQLAARHAGEGPRPRQGGSEHRRQPGREAKLRHRRPVALKSPHDGKQVHPRTVLKSAAKDGGFLILAITDERINAACRSNTHTPAVC